MADFTNNKEECRFEMHIDGHIAFLEYTVEADNIYILTHTEVPEELRGGGIARQLTEQSLSAIKNEGGKIIPLCPYTTAFLAKHPEWKDLLASKK